MMLMGAGLRCCRGEGEKREGCGRRRWGVPSENSDVWEGTREFFNRWDCLLILIQLYRAHIDI